MTQPGPTGAARRTPHGWAGAALTLLWAALLHHGIGPGFRKGSWIEPSSFLLGSVPGELLPALAVLVLPSAVVTAAVCLVAPSVLPRALAGIATVASACFVFYGIEADRIWRFFHWRWSVAALLFAMVAAIPCYAPVLAARWRRLGWPLRIATYLPFFAFCLVYERDVTGTNPELPLAISPWPVVQVMGLGFVAWAVAAIELGVALGLAGIARGLGFALLGLAGALAIPVGSLALGSSAGLLPFRAGATLYATLAAATLVVLAACTLWAPRRREDWASRAATIGLGGFLVALPLVVGQALARLDYSATRDGRAQEIIAALATHRDRAGAYPEELGELVSAGLLAEVPRPSIGFLTEQDFVYQNFGESYLLEFSAPGWIQCAYNPPWLLEPGEEPDPEAGEDAEGAWSCPQNPPELW